MAAWAAAWPKGSVGVIVQTGQNDRAAGGARRGGAERIGKADTLGSKRIEVGSLNNRITVASKRLAAVVVADDEYNVGTFRGLRHEMVFLFFLPPMRGAPFGQ